MLTVAIQKSGRLYDDTKKLFHECSIDINGGTDKKLKAVSSNFPLQILFLRDDDICECVADGAADIGIVGENEYLENRKGLNIIKRLEFARCRLSIAIPKEMEYSALKDLEGRSIATSYPGILRKYLKGQNITCSIREIKGSVEIAPGIGMADAIFDIVSTGSALMSNGLKEVEKIMDSEAVLVARQSLSKEKECVLDTLLFRIDAVKKAHNYKYILLNVPNEKIDLIISLLPGIKSPTIMPLAQKGWSSVHSVIHEDNFWNKIEVLKQNGAQGILIVPIEKMII